MFAKTIRKQMAKTIRYIKPTPYRSATGLTAELYQADFLPVPPVTLHSPVPEIMAGFWSILRETLNAGQVERTLKEAVAATVSNINDCPYCVDVHTAMLHATADHKAASAIRRGDYDGIHDSQIEAVVQWIVSNRTLHTNRVLPPPFSGNDAPEIIGTAVTFHYINRMVNIFLGDSFVPVPLAFKGLAGRLFGATAGKRFINGSPQQGDSLKFVPQVELPDDLSWAASNPAVASAFAGFAQVVEEAGQAVLPEAVRVLVSTHVQEWNGEAMGISRHWAEDAIVEIKEKYRAAARLALLTALASYQIDSSIVEGFRSQYPDDVQLVAATAWASFMAARRVGVWLGEPFRVAM